MSRHIANPVGRRRAARTGMLDTATGQSMGYASVRHIGEHRHPAAAIPRLPAPWVLLDVPEAVRSAATPEGRPWPPLNPCVTVYQDALWIVIRLYEYDQGRHRTANLIGRVVDGNKLDVRPMRTVGGQPIVTEDIRLCAVGDRLFGVGARPTVHPPYANQAIMHLTPSGDVVSEHLQPSRRMEKNWSLVAVDGRLRVLYAIAGSRAVMMDYDETTRVVRPQASALASVGGTFRGGSQLAAIPQGQGEPGWLAIVHEVYRDAGGWPTYVHRFVRFDARLETVRIGQPWVLREPGIEFVAGLTWWKDAWIISWGYRDREAFLSIADPAAMRGWIPA